MPDPRRTGWPWLSLVPVLCALGAAPVVAVHRQIALIEGTVEAQGPDGHTLPLSPAVVVVTSDDGRERWTVLTEVDGTYKVEVPVGKSYWVSAEKTGFAPPATVAARMWRWRFVAVPNGTPARANLTMLVGGAIEGSVTSYEGRPVVGAAVSALRISSFGQVMPSAGSRESSTDDAGKFRIHSLSPGTYVVRVVPDYYSSTSGRWVKSGQSRTGMLVTYAPGVNEAGEHAAKVTVGPGELVTLPPFAAAVGPLSDLDCEVVTSDGRPALRPDVLLSEASGLVPRTRSVPTGDGNRVRFIGIQPGGYVLSASGSTTDHEEEGLASISVGPGQRTLTVSLSRPVQVRGVIRVTGPTRSGAQRPLGILRYGPRALALQLAQQGLLSPYVVPMQSEEANPGEWNMVSGPSLFRLTDPGLAVQSVSFGGATITDDLADLAQLDGRDRGGLLEVTVTADSGGVAGVVTTASGDPVDFATVVVFARDPRRWGTFSRFVKITYPDDRGRFMVEGLLPGEYLAAALGDVDETQASSATALSRAVPLSRFVDVSPASVGHVNLIVEVAR